VTGRARRAEVGSDLPRPVRLLAPDGDVLAAEFATRAEPVRVAEGPAERPVIGDVREERLPAEPQVSGLYARVAQVGHQLTDCARAVDSGLVGGKHSSLR